MDDHRAIYSEEGDTADWWMAAGAFVLLVASFRPWFGVRFSAEADGPPSLVQSKNAWTASLLWCEALVCGLMAVLVWFGSVRGLTQRSRRFVAAGLLLAALVVMVVQWNVIHEPKPFTITRILTVGDIHDIELEPPPPRRPFQWEPINAYQEGGYRHGVEPAHDVGAAALAGMFLIAAGRAAAAFRPGAGKRPGAAPPPVS